MAGGFPVALVAGVQTLAILAGILINDLQLKKFCAHMMDRFDWLERRMSRFERLDER
jgi:hypothetical protein